MTYLVGRGFNPAIKIMHQHGSKHLTRSAREGAALDTALNTVRLTGSAYLRRLSQAKGRGKQELRTED